jgi:hypothetical protein
MFRYQKQITIFFTIFILVFTISYGIFRFYPIITGPKISIYTPEQGLIVDKTSITISGETQRVSKLYINGSKINLNKKGDFATTLAIYKGHNILIVEGYDRFGRLTTITKNIGTKNN